MLKYIREGDTIVVWKIDRLSRSLKDLMILLDKISQCGAHFRSLTETINTDSSGGRMLIHMIGSIAEFEREMIRERTIAGLKMARKNGVVFGRPHKLSKRQKNLIYDSVMRNEMTQAELARILNVSPQTVMRAFNEIEILRKEENGREAA